MVEVQVHPPQQQQEPGAKTTVLVEAQVVPTFELKVTIYIPPPILDFFTIPGAIKTISIAAKK